MSGKYGRETDGRFGSGNPGKPKGARHRVTESVRILLEGEAEALTRKAIEAALGGDMIALRLCIDRIAPARKDAVVAFPLPKLEAAKDIVPAAAAVVRAVSVGDLSPAEAAHVMALIEAFRRALETNDLAERVARLENLENPD